MTGPLYKQVLHGGKRRHAVLTCLLVLSVRTISSSGMMWAGLKK